MRSLRNVALLAVAIAVVLAGMVAWKGSPTALARYGPSTWNVPVVGGGGGAGGRPDGGRDRGGDGRRGGGFGGDERIVDLPADLAARLPDQLRTELAARFGAGKAPADVVARLERGGGLFGDGGPQGDGGGPPVGGGEGGGFRPDGGRGGDRGQQAQWLDALDGFRAPGLALLVALAIAATWEVVRGRRRRSARAAT